MPPSSITLTSFSIFMFLSTLAAQADGSWMQFSVRAARAYKHDPSQALSCYDKAISLLPPDEDGSLQADLLLNKVSVLLQLKRRAEAAQILNELEPLMKHAREQHSLLYVRYLRRRVRCGFEKGDTSTCLRCQDELIDATSQIFGRESQVTYSELLSKAFLAEATGQWNQALEALCSAGKFRPLLRGRKYQELLDILKKNIGALVVGPSERDMHVLLDKLSSLTFDRILIAELFCSAAEVPSVVVSVKKRALDAVGRLGSSVTDDLKRKCCLINLAMMWECLNRKDYSSQALQYADNALSLLQFFSSPGDLPDQIYTMKSVIQTNRNECGRAEQTLEQYESKNRSFAKLAEMGGIFCARNALARAYLCHNEKGKALAQMTKLLHLLEAQRRMPERDRIKGASQINGYIFDIESGRNPFPL